MYTVMYMYVQLIHDGDWEGKEEEEGKLTRKEGRQRWPYIAPQYMALRYSIWRCTGQQSQPSK